MNTVMRNVARKMRRNVEDQTRPGPLTKRVGPPGERRIGRGWEMVGTQLDHSQPTPEDRFQPIEETGLVRWVLTRDDIEIGQPQGKHNGPVGSGQLARTHGLGVNPPQRLAFPPVRCAGVPEDAPDVEQYSAVSVVVPNPNHRLGGDRIDPQLLLELAGERGLGRLARLELTAGKLPQSALMHMVRAAGEKDPAPFVRQGGSDDVNRGRRHAVRSDTRR
jgi:hypothetical protein